MNKKLLEDLYAEAKKSTKEGRMNAPVGVVAEKFAELIANECAELCDRFQERDVGMQPAECAGAIRMMFGIK